MDTATSGDADPTTSTTTTTLVDPILDPDRICAEDPTKCRVRTVVAEPQAPPPAPRGRSGTADAGPGGRGEPLRPSAFGTPRFLDAADPAAIAVDGRLYVYSTSSAGFRLPVRILDGAALDSVPPPIATGTWNRLAPPLAPTGPYVVEGMYDQPAWMDGIAVWAPTIARLGGRYVLFFAGRRPAPPDPVNAECIGRAFSDRPDGPFVPEATPFTCGLRGIHGAIDPSVFLDDDGSVWLHAAFGATVTPLHTIPLTATGDAAGPARPLLGFSHRWETWFLENPSMYRDGRGYVLAYSVGDWKLPRYATGLAACAGPAGPCRSVASRPWLASTAGRTGPGGLSFFDDTAGNHRAIFHSYPEGMELPFLQRSAHVMRVTRGAWPELGP